MPSKDDILLSRLVNPPATISPVCPAETPVKPASAKLIQARKPVEVTALVSARQIGQVLSAQPKLSSEEALALMERNLGRPMPLVASESGK